MGTDGNRLEMAAEPDLVDPQERQGFYDGITQANSRRRKAVAEVRFEAAEYPASGWSIEISAENHRPIERNFLYYLFYFLPAQ